MEFRPLHSRERVYSMVDFGMKSTMTVLFCLLSMIVPAPAELSELEKKYLHSFANYRGGLGIGIVPQHTYDFALRQAVLKSKDENVQRAFILKNLPARIDSLLWQLESNRAWTGKTTYRQMTPAERAETVQSFAKAKNIRFSVRSTGRSSQRFKRRASAQKQIPSQRKSKAAGLKQASTTVRARPSLHLASARPAGRPSGIRDFAAADSLARNQNAKSKPKFQRIENDSQKAFCEL